MTRYVILVIIKKSCFLGEKFMENINENEVKDFLKACNDFINGKFILAEVKLSKVLQEIAKSKDVYNVIAECLNGYDFEREFARSRANNLVGGSNFRLPIESHKIIPLVFCLLVEIDRKRIDFNYFLKTQFSHAETQKEEYDAFITTVMVPFRDAFKNMFGIDTVEEQKLPETEVNVLDKPKIDKPTIEKPEINTIEELEEEDINDFFISIKKLASSIIIKLENIKNKQNKEAIKIYAEGLKEAASIKNFNILNAFVYALNAESKKEKAIKANVNEINNLYFTYFK